MVKANPEHFNKDLVGGYYDARDAIKFNFPQSFAITMLSWSVIEYIKRVLITVEQRSMHDENPSSIPTIKTQEHARIEAHCRICHNWTEEQLCLFFLGSDLPQLSQASRSEWVWWASRVGVSEFWEWKWVLIHFGMCFLLIWC